MTSKSYWSGILRRHWPWLLGVAVPMLVLGLYIALGLQTSNSWLPLIFLVVLAVCPGLVSAFGGVSIRFVRRWVYSVGAICLVLWVALWMAAWLDFPVLNPVFWILMFPLIVPLFLGVAAAVSFAVGLAIGQTRRLGVRAVQPLLVGFGLVVAGLLLAMLVGRLPTNHSDAMMVDNFWSHEAQFRQLAEMSNEDVEFSDIAHDFTHPSHLKLSDARLAVYRRLFDELHLHRLVRRPNGQILLSYWSSGWAVEGDIKGYIYSPELPSEVVDSLDNFPTHGNSGEVYRALTDRWYLYYLWVW